MNKSGIWVIVPAYNEESTISSVLKELVNGGYSIVIVDDGSFDRTSQLSLQLPVTVLRHPVNLGQGAAIQTGISYTLQQPGAEYLVTFDADGQHDASEIDHLVGPLTTGDYDVVLGSRFLEPGGTVNMPAGRRVLLHCVRLFTILTTGLSITDNQNGFRAFTAAAAAKLNITQNGMAHSSEITVQISRLKLRWVERPVTVRYTAYSMRKGQRFTNSLNIVWDMLRARAR